MSNIGEHDCREHEGGGPSLSFCAPGQDVSAVDQLMHGIRRLWPLVQPLTAEAVIGCISREIDYPDNHLNPQRPHWFVYDRLAVGRSGGRGGDPRQADDQLLDVVNPWHVDPVVDAVPELSVQVIRSWLEQAQTQPSPAPQTHDVGWTALWFNATRARACPLYPSDAPASPSPSEARAGSIRLLVAETLWVVDVPCEWRDGASWVAGPTRGMRRHVARAPLTLYATNAGEVKLSIAANWSLWTTDGSPGRAMLVDTGRTLLADGWRLTHAGRAFPEFA